MMDENKRYIDLIVILFLGASLFLLLFQTEDFVLRSNGELTQPDPLKPITVVLQSASESSDESDKISVENYGGKLRESISRLSRCASTCILGQIVNFKCAHSDYSCFCERLQTLSDLCESDSVKRLSDLSTCLDGCNSFDQWFSPGMILDICDAVDVEAVLPNFMQESLRIYGRQEFSSGLLLSSDAPIFTEVITFTELRPYDETYIYTLSTSYDGGDYATVIILTPESTRSSTSSLSTFSTTSFPSTSQTITAESSTLSTSTSTASSSSETRAVDQVNQGSNESGLSLNAKIGVGVAVPLVFVIGLLVAVWFLLRRRKRRGADMTVDDVTPVRVELGTHFNPDSGNKQEIVGGIQELNSIPSEKAVTRIGDAYKVGRDDVHSGNPESKTARELNNNEKSQSAVMSLGGGIEMHGQSLAETQKYELAGVQSQLGKLPDAPQQERLPEIERKPLSPKATYSSPPPPWEQSHEAEYMAVGLADLASSTTASVAPHDASSIAGDIDFEAIEEEMARIKAQKERLHAIQALEEREEQLRRVLEAKKGGGTRS